MEWREREGPDTLRTAARSTWNFDVQARPPSTSSASDYRQLACKWAMVYSSSYRNGMWLVATTVRLPLQFQGYDIVAVRTTTSNLSTLKNQMIA
jgi:hypothetical protein